MRLLNYISESKAIVVATDFTDMIEILKKDCKSYLKMLGGSMPFMKGIRELQGHGLVKKKTNEVRKTKGMFPSTAKRLNVWLKKNNHTTRDGSVIVSSDRERLNYFGTAYYVFPIGKVDYTWVESRDINLYDGRTGWGEMGVEIFFKNPDTFDDDYKTRLRKPFGKYFHTNSGWKKAQNFGYETWFKCEEFYLLRSDYILFPELINELR
jgi:hypothetical protein